MVSFLTNRIFLITISIIVLIIVGVVIAFTIPIQQEETINEDRHKMVYFSLCKQTNGSFVEVQGGCNEG